jgi:hypothetical protein
VLAYMKGGGNKFVANLGRQMTDNPMPVTLIGAGLAWFLFAKNSGANGNGIATGSRAGNTKPHPKQPGNGFGDTASAAAEKVDEMASATANGVSAPAHSVGDTGSGACHQAADNLTKVKGSAIEAEEKTIAAARNAVAFCRDHPLILAGIGLALGAAIGGALPSTEVEDRLMGEASDEIKDAAKVVAVDQLDKAKAVGGRIGEALQEDIQSADPNGGKPSAGYVPQSGQ